MAHDRRDFLRRAGALGASGFASRLAPLSLLAAHAAPAQAAEDYKALVCVFLFGGMDGNNVVIPVDAGYASYAATRPESSGINIAQSKLLPLPMSDGSVYGLHPSLADIHPLFGQGKLAVLANVGSLTAPTTRANYGAARPDNLYSHADQQGQWQSAVAEGRSATGWGGRIADAVDTGGAFPVMTSIAGASLFTLGTSTQPLALSATGGLSLQGFGNNAAGRARLGAFQSILASASGNAYVEAAAGITSRAASLSGLVNPILTAATSSVTPHFAGQNSSIAQELLQVAKLIEARAQTGARRQVFFVSLGGFDTHSNELNTLTNLLGQLGPALKGFYEAMGALGVADRVTTFTLSDFGRTFQPASGGGSDHAWGNHHFILGGAVRGAAMYGRYPVLVPGGPDDAEAEGRWIPTTSIEQYGATLARWFGVPEVAIPAIFPNLARFAPADLGFLA